MGRDLVCYLNVLNLLLCNLGALVLFGEEETGF